MSNDTCSEMLKICAARFLRLDDDGITILGGEPFAQKRALAQLTEELTRLDEHIVVYSGYTYEQLARRAASHYDVEYVLDHIDILIDGQYFSHRLPGGPWTGSGNQRVLDMVATRRRGKVVLYQVPTGVGKEEE